jgi:hypothetical protein
MAIIYNSKKDEYEAKGYTPFVCIVKWAPEEEPTFLARFSRLYTTPEGQGVKGLHGWNLIGRNTMLLIAWMNSSVSFQKFCTSITYGTGITIEACPAIDHFGLKKALEELKSRLPKIPVPKVAARKSRASKTEG